MTHDIHYDFIRTLRADCNSNRRCDQSLLLVTTYTSVTIFVHRDDLKSLEYTTMCIKEAMRFYIHQLNMYIQRVNKYNVVLDGNFNPNVKNNDVNKINLIMTIF